MPGLAGKSQAPVSREERPARQGLRAYALHAAKCLLAL